ncbi:polymorphic toxin type 30 domain-containing protein, partial [Streptomyces sp. NPDC127061]|uniref:polymorphic toxin type 30 domain-containing protein n=1 Tax=Streptomyces sp. NPDC127061 TaxID=3347122 RepID=UPI003646E75F
AAEFRQKAQAYNAVRNTDHPLPHPGKFSDPGLAKRQLAQEVLQLARQTRNEAAETAKGAVTAAMAHAPKEPAGLDRLKREAYDHALGQGIELAHFSGGIVKGGAGLVNFVRSVNPTDPYNLTHPADYFTGVHTTLAGLVSTGANPDRALKSTWDSFKDDRSEFIGRLVPEMIGTKGGGLTKGGLRAGIKDLLERPKGKNRHGHEQNPDSNSNQCSKVKCAGDPIDVATGRMLLPQTDIVLPGSLPLVFERVFDSSYRAGRWFGSGWSSTVDQRLEIDAEGVVFSCNEGSLLAYPHPAPGVPVMPTHGRRWPLDKVDGGYTITDPETGHVRHFVDQPNGELALLAQIDDRNNRWITFEYDETGAPTSIVHHGGYHLKLTTNDGRITALHLAGAAPDDTDQEILRYGYTDGHLTEVTNSSGKPLRFGCDEHGRITSWTDTNGSRYDYAYDEHDRCVHQTGTNGHLEAHFTWNDTDPHTGLRMTSMTDSLGHTKRCAVNDRSQVVAEIDPLGAVTRYEHDRYHRLLSVTDPLGHTTRSTYDEHGNLTSVVRPDGRELTAEYNTLGLPVRVKGTDGMVTRQTYDGRGNCTSITDPAGITTRFTYNEAGHLTVVTDPLGHTTLMVCDQTGLPSAVTDPLGSVTHYERDAFGRPVAITDPTGATIHLEWTVEGRPSRRTAPNGASESWTYDGEGNCTSHTDPMDGVFRFEYTHFDVLAARAGVDGERHEFEHDTELRLTNVVNSRGSTWSYKYDATGHLASETDFDGRTLTYTRDATGRLLSRTNALGQTVRLERNELGQVVRKDAAGEVTTYAYDLTDQVAQATGPSSSTLTVLRDRFGRVREETVDGRLMTYCYDELGRRTGRRTPSGAATTWSYDAAGRRVGMLASGRAIDFSYDEVGRELTRRIGETLLEHTFDALGRLTAQAVTVGGGDLVQQRAYTYRADGHLLSVVDHLSGSRRFDLDLVGRVTAVHAANWTETYAYDEANNQTHATWPLDHPGQEAVGARAYAGTRITRAGGVRYEHDALGRITLRQKTRLSSKPDTWRYAWDAEDRLTSVVTPDGTRWRYTYDPLGRRTAKLRLSEDGETVVEQVVFTWDETTLCEQTTTSPELPHPVTLTWDHQGLQPLAQRERITAADAPQEEIDSRFFAIVTDLTGTPSELVDDEGRIAWRTRSTLWGVTAWAANSTTYTPLRFPGQYYDLETGLHYNYFRHYDPATARYLTSDPLGLEPSPNPVAYVLNPHAWVDPLGLAPCPPRIEGGGWDMRNRNPLDVVPDGAEMRALKPDSNGGAQKGVEYKWKDSETGNTVRLRVHDKDGTAPEGSNAANGDTYRISIGGKYQDEAGTLYHRQVHNENSPNYNKKAANLTHIPWPSQYPLPY